MKQLISLGILALLSLPWGAQAETSAASSDALSPATMATVHGQSADLASLPEESAQKTPAPSGSDLKKAQEAQALFEESLRQMMPLDKEHIQEYRKRSDQRERALLPVSPDLRTRTVRVTLEPGRAPVKVFTTANIATSLVFHDSTGQPWPITSVTNGRAFLVSGSPPGSAGRQSAQCHAHTGLCHVNPRGHSGKSGHTAGHQA